MLSIQTTRFGTIEIEENRTIHFPEGLLGFPDQRDYIILEHKPGSPFCWLQSTDRPDLAFVVVNPFLVKADYLEDLSPEERIFFTQKSKDDLIVFALVTIPRDDVEKMTVNLLGPLVIDVQSRHGRQVILANSGYPHRYPVMNN
jgi:flagellar assembly factor FliW